VTSPGGNNINLATLWVPMMPETSHMEEAARKGGEAARRGFESGFGSGGGGGLSQLGQTMASQLASGFKQGMSHLELPGGFTNLTEGAMRGFEGMATRSESAKAALEKLKESEEQLINSHNRLAVAQSRMNDLQQRGVTSGTQYMSASSSLIGAKQREESAVRSVSEAHEGYANALSASKGGMFAFAAETGILAGAVAGAIPLVGSLIEGIIDFWKEAAEKGVETSIEFAKKLMEIGEEYHHLGIQVQEFSSASGEALEELESAAQRVFSSLDVAGETTGKTMAVLASRLKTTDVEALEPLVRHVEELHGRFGDLNPTDVGTAFAAMRVDIADADNVLAAWLNSARTAGVSTGALVDSLAKVGEILRPEITHLSAEQLGEWIAQMQSVVPNVNRTVQSLNAAQKDFSAHGMNFAEGMAETIKELQSAATEFDKEEIAEKLFGTRRWSVALDMANRYAEIVAKGPEAFRRSGTDIDEFTRRTQDLGNKWEEVKKKIELALLPLGADLLSHAGAGLDKLNNYIHTHSDQMAQWVKHIGESFIALLPTLQTWAIDFLEILKPVAQGIEIWGSGLLLTIGGVAQSIATSMDILPGPLAHLIPGFDESKKAAHAMADATLDMGKKMAQARNPTGEFFDAVTGKIKDLHIDVPGLTKDFDALADSLGHRLGEAADQGINRPGLGTGLHLPGSEPGSPEAPGGAPGGEPAAPGGPPERPEPSGPHRVTPGAPAAPGAARPSSVQTPAQQGVYRAMVEAGFPNSWSAIQNIVSGEDAGWDVTATNNWDINAQQGNPSRGLGQLTLSNYRAAGVNPYTNDAYEQGRAMMAYIKGRYGTPEAAWEHWQISRNYQTGGFVTADPFHQHQYPWDPNHELEPPGYDKKKNPYGIPSPSGPLPGPSDIKPDPGTLPPSGWPRAGGSHPGRFWHPYMPPGWQIGQGGSHPLAPMGFRYGGIAGYDGGGEIEPVNPGYQDPDWRAYAELYKHTGQFNPNMRIDTSIARDAPMSPIRRQWNSGMFGLTNWFEDSKSGRSGGIDHSVAQWMRDHLMFNGGGAVPTAYTPGSNNTPWWNPNAKLEMDPGTNISKMDPRNKYGMWWDDPHGKIFHPGSPDDVGPGTWHGDMTQPGMPGFMPGNPFLPPWWFGGGLPNRVTYKWSGDLVSGGHGGIDDIPAWLTAGEFVMNKKATDKWLPTLRWMNADMLQGGSDAPAGSDRSPGLPRLDTAGAQVDTIAIAEAVAKVYGITNIGMYRGADQFHEHSSGEAADVMVGLNNPVGYQVKDFALANAAAFGVQYAIWQNQMWYPGQAPTPYGSTGNNTDKHMDHVHIATAGGGFPPGTQPGADFSKGLPTSHPTSNTPAPGVAAVMAGMGLGGATVPGSSLGGSGAPGGPAMGPPGTTAPPVGSPASTAGYGPYGFQTYDQWYQGNKAITGAQNRVTDINAQVTEKQKQLDQLNAEITAEQNKSLLLRDQAKLDSKTQERDRLQGEITKLRNTDLPAASEDVEQATRKAWEDAQKPPGGQQEYKIPGASEFSQLGGGLVKGISQAFGFGDIFAKPPWEWGIVKLMSGMANWGLGTANAWAEEIGKGHTGMTGFQPVAGMEQSGAAGLEGVLKGFGLNVPMPKPEQVDRFGRPVGPAGPSPVQPGPAPGSPGAANNAGGPVIQGDYMPINVSPNVNPSAVLAPVQEQRNAENAKAFQFDGGMPR
jgi:hypothetical protein